MKAMTDSFFKNSMRIVTVILFLLLIVPHATTRARDDFLEVPFLYSEDEKLPQTDPSKAIPRSNALSTNQFLNAPMTRMEYMLTRLEARLDKDSPGILSRVNAAFEPDHGLKYKLPASIEGFALYDQEVGRIIVGYNIGHLGKPLKPMRTTCDEILSELRFIIPQESLGYTYYNTILGVLVQKEPSEYLPMLKTFSQNIVHKVTLLAETNDGKVVHCLTCQRTEKEAPISYYRYSFKVKDK